MKSVFIKCMVLISALSFPLTSFASETVKLRFSASLYFDAKGGSLSLPEGVACGGKGYLLVADTGDGRLLKYTVLEGNVTGGEEIKVPEVPYPLKVQLNSKSDIFVLDGKQRRIALLASDGTFKGFLEPSAIPPPAAFVPRSFRIDGSDNFYLLDIFSGRVLVLDSTGKFVRQVDFPQKYGFFSDLAVDSRGTIYLLDAVDAVVYSAAKDAKGFSALSGKLEEYLNFPANIVVDSRDIIYLADQNGSGVVALGPDGSFLGRLIGFGWKDGLLRYPAQMCIGDSGDFFVADRENSRIEIFGMIR